jgi:hypothetical protein
MSIVDITRQQYTTIDNKSTENVKAMPNPEEALRKVIDQFQKAQATGDETAFLKLWHPKAQRFSIGFSKELFVFTTEDILKLQFGGIRQQKEKDPDFVVTYEMSEVQRITVDPDALTASAQIDWRMKIKDEVVGDHSTFLNFVKVDGNWMIANVVDRGAEPKDS